MIIIYTRPDGGLCITVAAPKERLELVLGPLTEDAYREHVLGRSIPQDAINPQIMPDDWMGPKDRTFRNAWKLEGNSVIVDMPKARDIQRDSLRAERIARMEALDVAMLKAIERGDIAASKEVSEQKQALRDAPAHPAINAANSPEELKALTLDELTKYGKA